MPEGPTLKLIGYQETLTVRSYIVHKPGTDPGDMKNWETLVRITPESGKFGISIPMSQLYEITSWIKKVFDWRAIQIYELTQMKEYQKKWGNPK